MSAENNLEAEKGSYAPSSLLNPGEFNREDGSRLTTAVGSQASSLKNEPLAAEPDDGVVYPSGARLGMIVVALALSIFLVALDMTIVATAIPKIVDEFHNLESVAWIGSAFFLTIAAFQSTWGKAYKYFPLKLTFLIAIFIFEVGSLICGVAPNDVALIVGRAIAGVGGAGIASGSYTIIGFAVRPKLRPAFTGILGAAYGIASVIGPLLGGVFAEKSTWRWCFYINLPIGGASAAVIFFFFTTPPNAVPVVATWKETFLQLDLPGAAVVMAGVVCYILGLQYGGVTKAWSSGPVIACLVLFAVLVIVFIALEIYQGERAMIVSRIARDRTIAVAMVYIMFLGGAFFILLYYLPIYFQVVANTSASQSGIRNLPLILGTTIATILSGALITATGQFAPFMLISAVLTTAGAGLIFTLGVDSPSSQWIGYQALAGLGIGFGLQVPIIAGQALSSQEDLSSVTAMILFMQTIGGAFFVSAGQSAFSNVLLLRLPALAPGIDPAAILAVGSTEIRNAFPVASVPGIIAAYMDGLQAAYAISIASAGIAVLSVLGLGWRWKTLPQGASVAGAV